MIRVNAKLKTACGCERTVELPYPPERILRVPIFPRLLIEPISNSNKDFSKVSIRVREFELVDVNLFSADYAMAVYEEKLDD
jgi:hypothetical protein